MEGVLYKWTNYMTVHPTDSTRLELIIPGEQHFYVKAVNAAERQKWLVALGSSKAGLIDTRTKKERELTETTESLKTKMSELRLYCDLLMQQVHTIQESVEQEGESTVASTETRNEASSLLSATCETFIKTLEECMKIANSKFQTDMLQSSPSDSVMSPVQMSRMKRSISHPGTYNYERSSLPKECTALQKSTQRRTRTCSDTEAHSDRGAEETERLMFHKANINGDSTPSIPEEVGTSTKFLSETDTPESDLSL
ncbi:pleckstrin homology domain-containing family A member 3 isoform X2 [Chanodichthys erythropterus]|uniref:pleckstrin homology domain-containing family A member 3 isoform X2 n=1 Tax=Chanodichthys erythropterus TaxID=933992 RepID=UPI00351F7E66